VHDFVYNNNVTVKINSRITMVILLEFYILSVILLILYIIVFK